MDSYASGRFTTPIANPSSVLVQHTARIALYQMRNARGMASEQQRQDYDDAIEWLDKLAAGKVRPSDPLPAKSAAVKSAWVKPATDSPVTKKKLEGFT